MTVPSAHLLALSLLASAALAAEPAMEKRVLFDATSAKTWSPAECTIAASDVRTREGRPALHWHVTVDHYAGEAKYPIGWPRISNPVREPAARDWSGWDYLEIWVYADTSRAALPREAVGMAVYAPDKASAFNRPLSELAKGRWTQVRIPLTQIPRHSDVRMFQFHISESRYQHKDTLDVYVDEIVLLRYARPTLLEFAAEEAIAFADARQLTVRFNAVGVKAGDSADVTCELRQGDKALAATTAKVMRGPQRLVLDLAKARLPAGEYQIVARIAGGDEAKTSLRLVESPWATTADGRKH